MELSYKSIYKQLEQILLIVMGTRVSKQDVKVPHFYFGQVSRRNQYGKEIITVSKQMIRRDEYDEWVKKYHEAKNYNQESLLLPESCQRQQIKKYMACCECPADFEMSLSFEKFDYLYNSQIVQRKKENKPYREQELFILFFKLLTGLKDFQLGGRRLGDIRPSQMVITDRKNIQMINIASFPWELSSTDKILDKYDNTTKFYLSPEEIDMLSKKSRNKIIDAKAQAFSLGVTMLEASLLQNSQDLYGLNPRSINETALKQRLERVKGKYPQFWHYLAQILEFKVENRLSGGQMWSILNIYSQKISESQKFRREQSRESSSVTQFRRKSNM